MSRFKYILALVLLTVGVSWAVAQIVDEPEPVGVNAITDGPDPISAAALKIVADNLRSKLSVAGVAVSVGEGSWVVEPIFLPLDFWQCDADDTTGCQNYVNNACEVSNHGTGEGNAEVTSREDGSVICMGDCTEDGAVAWKDCPAAITYVPDPAGEDADGGNKDVSI